MSYTSKAKELLKQGHEQNVADIKAAYEESLKNLLRNVSAQVAAHGMNYSSLPGSMTAEGQAKLEAEKARNLNLEGMNYQSLLLDLMKPKGGGGTPTYQPGANPYLAGTQPAAGGTDAPGGTDTTGALGTANTTDPANTSVRAALMLKRIYAPDTLEGQATGIYTPSKRSKRSIMDKRLGLS